MIINNTRRLLAATLIVAALITSSHAQEIEEIVVTADFRERLASDIPASITALDATAVRQLAVQHFEELIYTVPNVNWSGDGHRARYLQIRGVGELEQYQGAPNPSVGFLVDDIDFSGIGTIATLFDVGRVEVLRGPQGTRYGANALGGLVYIQSAMPTGEAEGRLQLTAADDDTLAGGIGVGGSLTRDKSLLFRASAHHYDGNGFRDNAFLVREDTNGRSETTLRGRLRWLPSDVLTLDLAMLFTKIDNGYDAFAIDNSYTMLSDKPGKDAQESKGASLRVEYSGWQAATLTSITAFADSDIDFSFDADWGNDDSWSPFVYDFVSLNDRQRRTVSQEFRLASAGDGTYDWLVGLYALHLEDDLQTLNAGIYDDGVFPFSIVDPFDSNYESTSIALFGQVDRRVGAATTLTAGIRLERRTSDYVDSGGLVAGPSDTMVGGEITLTHDHTEQLASYVRLARGFKAGGFNLGIVPDELREFDEEVLWSAEAGIKALLADNKLQLNASVFYYDRTDQQVRLSFQLNPNDPASFGFATINADGTNLGAELETTWRPTDRWNLYARVGIIDAVIEEINLPTLQFPERGAAHAPRYTLAAGVAYEHPSGWFGRVDVSARDEFYFDVSHNQKSAAYELVNARIGYGTDRWSLQLWSRNLFDTDYAVRGFFFGNEPPDFPNTLYTRLGDPRQAGLTFDMRF